MGNAASDNQKKSLVEQTAKAAYEAELHRLFNSPSVPERIRSCFVQPDDALKYWSPVIRTPRAAKGQSDK